MNKHVSFFSILWVGLFAVVTFAHAEMTPEQAETNGYWARLTARPATTTAGTGTVSVNAAVVTEADAVFASVSSADAFSETYANTSADTEAHFNSIYAKPADGSYFAGWSFTDGGIDLNTQSIQDDGLWLVPSKEKGHTNIRAYNIYAAFQPIRLASYTVDTDNKVEAGESTFTITITAEADKVKSTGLGDGDAARHFKLPVVTQKEGTLGDWTTNVTEWVSGDNLIENGGDAELNIVVTLTAPDDEPREYAATLTMETKAGIKLEIPLYTRAIDAVGNHVNLYDENKVLKEEDIPFSVALDHFAASGDIIQLIGDYTDADKTIEKDITLDFNGFDFKKQLTISGDVTIPYSPFGGRVAGSKQVIVSSGGKLTANGGALTGKMAIETGAVVVINGATVGGKVTNNGTLTLTDGELLRGVTSSGTLTINGGTIKNESGTAVTVMGGGTAAINRGSISGSTYGLDVSGGTVTIEKLAAVSGDTKDITRAGGVVTVNNGKFSDPNKFVDGDITFNAGYFKTNENNVISVLGKSIMNNTAGVEYREGYKLFAGSQEAAQTSGVTVCRINQTAYSSLEDALAYANNNPDKPAVIILANDYTLQAGNYTIPANATLVVPMSEEQDAPNPTVVHKSISSSETYNTPYEFRRLTFADGVNMTVLGALEVSCAQASKEGASMQSIPDGPYGRLVLEDGSHITLGTGAELRAWGYITGEGVIDARQGATVREQFQIGDWKGGDIAYTMLMNEDPQCKLHLFPIYEYFIQNIESPVNYHPGAALLCVATVDISGLRAYADVNIIGLEGETAMFIMNQAADAENTWVRKRYDQATDRQVYEINSDAQLGSLVINWGEIPWSVIPGQSSRPGTMNFTMDSRKFVLPLTSNFTIRLLSGQMDFTQSTACLPGMELEIDKPATLRLVQNANPDVVDGALYLYDSDQWGRYVHGNTFGTIVNYSATVGGKPNRRNVSSAAALGNAQLKIHGTLQVASGCGVYTTAGKKVKEGTSDVYVADLTSGGASITSSNEDAGTFIFQTDAVPSHEQQVTLSGSVLTGMSFNAAGKLNEDVLMNYDPINGWAIETAMGNNEHLYNFQLCTSARLKNTDGSFVNTYTDANHYAWMGDAYCFVEDSWRKLRVDEDNECFMKDVADPLHPVYFAKPHEYVAITATKDGDAILRGNADHTFSDAVGSGRLFILTDNCQWWEVEKEGDLYHCIHPQNDTYYYWVDDNSYPEGGYWAEKHGTITSDLAVDMGTTTTLDAPVTYDNLIITSNGVDASGQLVGVNYLTLNGDAYFDLSINAHALTWYQVAVPWAVDVATGISVNDHTLALSSEMDVLEYDGARRATQGPIMNWNYLANGDVMQPGRLYMFALLNDASVVRFTKKAGEPLLTENTSVTAYPATTGDVKDRGWNGVANPALYHAYVNPGVTYGQIYNSTEGDYDIISFSEAQFVVGQGAFVQVDADKSIPVANGAAYAPRRAKTANEDRRTTYDVRIAPINKAYTDRVFVQTDEEKTSDIYTIGQDIAKVGVSTKVAQIWIDRYDAKLCVNTMAPTDTNTEYPLGIFTPTAGEYTISMNAPDTDNQESDLYLTLDGVALWNLSRSACVIALEKGTTSHYGLRISAKTPQIATAIDEAVVDSKEAIATKVLINNRVFIIRGGGVYSITGNKVK